MKDRHESPATSCPELPPGHSPMSPLSLAALAACLCLCACDRGKDAAAAELPSDPRLDAKKDSAPSLPPLAGRCENESADAPYSSLYFYPEKREMFVSLDGAGLRLPLTVTTSSPEKVDFTFKWLVDDSVKTGSGSLSRVGTQKWSLDADLIKGSICSPEKDDLFYKPLTEIGIRAGDYLNAKANDTMKVVAGSQQIISKEKSKTEVFYYRVRTQSAETGVGVYTTSEVPTAEKSIMWSSWQITAAGDDLIVRFNEKNTRTYSLVK